MAQCVELAASSVVSSAAEPCTSFVLLTSAEYGLVIENPFRLSIEDGASIAGLIASVWVSAFCIRALIRVLRDRGDDE